MQVDLAQVCFARWYSLRQKNESNRLFKKAHVVSGTKTNVITSVEITDGYAQDNTLFKTIVEHAFENFQAKELSADMAYSCRENLRFIGKHGAIPYITFRKNTKRRFKGYPIWSIMYRYFKENHEKYIQHYNQRSNAETLFSMIKR